MRKKRKLKKVARHDTSSKAKKVAKRKASAKKRSSKVPKTRNSGTMTESAFWSWIRSALRQKSRFWKPILEVKKRAQIPYKGPNKRRKYSYICEECGGEFDSKQVNVHHEIECGSLNCANDLPGFVERLFCEKEDLKLICNGCHDKKHKKEVNGNSSNV